MDTFEVILREEEKDLPIELKRIKKTVVRTTTASEERKLEDIISQKLFWDKEFREYCNGIGLTLEQRQALLAKYKAI